MFDHVGIVVTDLKRSAVLYGEILAPLGLTITEKHRTGPGEGWIVISNGAPFAPFFVLAAGRPSFWRSGHTPAASPAHLCFVAPTQDAVDRFHSIGLAGGATDNGAPSLRQPNSYAAFLIDFDGNNIEARCWLRDAA